MIRYLLTLILFLISTAAEARVDRGYFTSNGTYIMNYQENDYRIPNDYNYPRYNNLQQPIRTTWP